MSLYFYNTCIGILLFISFRIVNSVAEFSYNSELFWSITISLGLLQTLHFVFKGRKVSLSTCVCIMLADVQESLYYSFEVIFSLEGGSTERVTSAILLYSFLKIRERFINKNVARVLNKTILQFYKHFFFLIKIIKLENILVKLKSFLWF